MYYETCVFYISSQKKKNKQKTKTKTKITQSNKKYPCTRGSGIKNTQLVSLCIVWIENAFEILYVYIAITPILFDSLRVVYSNWWYCLYLPV